jgi:hypothetical protein
MRSPLARPISSRCRPPHRLVLFVASRSRTDLWPVRHRPEFRCWPRFPLSRSSPRAWPWASRALGRNQSRHGSPRSRLSPKSQAWPSGLCLPRIPCRVRQRTSRTSQSRSRLVHRSPRRPDVRKSPTPRSRARPTHRAVRCRGPLSAGQREHPCPFQRRPSRLHPRRRQSRQPRVSLPARSHPLNPRRSGW